MTPLIRQLHNAGRLRVWSLIITIFGDVVHLRGGRVAMAELQVLTEHLNIDVRALRTAMSRLAKEGWVVREKQGRNTFYRLSSKGIRAFAPASERIYAGPVRQTKQDWHLAVGPDLRGRERTEQDKMLGDLGGLILRPGCALWPAETHIDLSRLQALDMFVVSGKSGTCPAWLSKTIAPDELAAAYRDLMGQFALVHDRLSDLAGLSPLDAMAMRILLIHAWRRLVLRHEDVPAALAPTSWPEAPCRDMVADIYLALLPRSETWWQDAVAPEGEAALKNRFR